MTSSVVHALVECRNRLSSKGAGMDLLCSSLILSPVSPQLMPNSVLLPPNSFRSPTTLSLTRVAACSHSSSQPSKSSSYTSAADHDSCNSLPPVMKLEMINVSKTYGDRVVLDGVSIEVKQGEVVGLLGPNGAGKSTAFSIMAGREKPLNGRVKLCDRDITALSLQQRAFLGLGYLPQEPSVFRGLTVHDNMLLVLQETGYKRELRGQRLQDLLEEFNLEHVENTLGKHLSGGERRRAELARSLASNCSGGPPRILLIDEPFAGVDPIGVSEIQLHMQRLKEFTGIGILITDHNVNETLRICDRAYIIYNGTVIASGEPDKLCDNPYVKKYYLGESFRRV